MAKKNNIPDFEGMVATLKKDAVRYASRAGILFFEESFYNQGWTDNSFEPWQARANDVDPGRKILIKSSGLLNSLQVFSASEERIEFGSDEVHAQIHNEGGAVVIPITAKSRRYFWAMFRATQNDMWKALALTKKQSITIVIPKRQFMGESATFMRQLDEWLLNTINNRFKTL